MESDKKEQGVISNLSLKKIKIRGNGRLKEKISLKNENVAQIRFISYANRVLVSISIP